MLIVVVAMEKPAVEKTTAWEYLAVESWGGRRGKQPKIVVKRSDRRRR